MKDMKEQDLYWNFFIYSGDLDMYMQYRRRGEAKRGRGGERLPDILA